MLEGAHNFSQSVKSTQFAEVGESPKQVMFLFGSLQHSIITGYEDNTYLGCSCQQSKPYYGQTAWACFLLSGNDEEGILLSSQFCTIFQIQMARNLIDSKAAMFICKHALKSLRDPDRYCSVHPFTGISNFHILHLPSKFQNTSFSDLLNKIGCCSIARRCLDAYLCIALLHRWGSWGLVGLYCSVLFREALSLNVAMNIQKKNS